MNYINSNIVRLRRAIKIDMIQISFRFTFILQMLEDKWVGTCAHTCSFIYVKRKPR